MNFRYLILPAILVAGAMPALAEAPEISIAPMTRPDPEGALLGAVTPVIRPADLDPDAEIAATMGEDPLPENSPEPGPETEPELAEVEVPVPFAEGDASEDLTEEEIAALAEDAAEAEPETDEPATAVAETDETPVIDTPEAEVEVADVAASDEAPVETVEVSSRLPMLRPADLVPAAVLPEGEADAADPATDDTTEVAEVSRGLILSPVPVPRPRVIVRAPSPEAPAAVVTASSGPVATPAPTVPPGRPKGLLATIFRAPNKNKYPTEGSVCGDPAIRGQAIPPIPAKMSGCGLQNPVRITAVDGVALTTPATVSCETAGALRSWVTNTVIPTVGKTGGGLAALRVAGSYTCRTRNHVPGAPVSEHGKGKAIDISALILKDGTVHTVLAGWRDRVAGPILQTIHARACGTFGTVLGPKSDAQHQDHLHLDVAKHGYGPYCR
ncbi:extensin family protein [Psychromarinibacter halotolerans]|uniref:Extensin family protein n=1 Tax=Psychromarinibacter halotolerans TaxID=1775175 RepID=A0ABV7GPT5_9RHOB|nr:extensin family protein [Psychromarinibacter halotolerans]MDF0597880.1 extensin family protein [Psychromarinibacter halotolerans]